VVIRENFWSEGDKVTKEENDLPSAPFPEEEIKATFLVIMQKGHLG
jgi:hypothetical protein